MKKLKQNLLEFYGTVAVPVIYALGLYLISKQDMELGVTVQILGLVTALIGLLLWIKSFRAIGKSFGVLPRRQTRIKVGVYQYLKHPMYLGIILTYVGLAAAGESSWGLLYTIFILLPLLTVRAYLENKLLT